MKPKMTNLLPAAVCSVMFAALIILVLGYPPHAKRFLVIACSIGLILSAILILRELTRKRRKASLQEENEAAEDKHGLPLNKFLTTSAWIVGVVPLVCLVGFTIGISLYVFIYYKLHGGRWLSSFVLGLAMAAVVYFVFVVGLGVRFPKPILLPFLRW